MKKFFAFFKTYLEDGLVYPANFVGWLLIGIIPLAVLPFVWLATFNGQESLAGLTQKQMVTYFVALMFVQRLTSADIVFGIAQEIGEGRLSFTLLKPVSFVTKLLGLTLSAQFRNSLVVAIIVTISFLLLPQYLVKPYSFSLLLYSLTALILAFIVNFLFNFCLGLISFWTLNVRGIFIFVFLTARFLGGLFAPIKIYPPLAQKIAFILPFKYGMAFPLEVYLSSGVNWEVLAGFIVQVLWIALMVILARFLWTRGVKRFSAYGG